MGQKQKTEKKKERERERLNNGDNNGQATHGARKHAWRTQAAWANIIIWVNIQILKFGKDSTFAFCLKNGSKNLVAVQHHGGVLPEQ